MTWTPQETARFNSLANLVAQQGLLIAELQECCCRNTLRIVRVDVTWFEPEGNPTLPFEDIMGEEACIGAKGIIVTVDATLYMEKDELDGWRIMWAAHGGLDL